MSTPNELAEFMVRFQKRKEAIKDEKKALSDELKTYERELVRLTIDLNQGDLFYSENKSEQQ